MRKNFGREIALLMLPILIIGGVGVFLTRKNAVEGPPENLESGPPRLVMKLRSLQAAPFDRYRGYTHKIAIDQWAAGELPSKPTPRAGATRSYRQIVPNWSSFYVAFRQGKTWKRTLSLTEKFYQNKNIDSKISVVPTETASIYMESIDSAATYREKFTTNYSLRIPSPDTQEAVLIGRLQADIEDHDVRLSGGVPSDTPVKSTPIYSKTMRLVVPLLKETSEPENSAQIAKWKADQILFFAPTVGFNYLRIDLTLKPLDRNAEKGAIRMVNPRLLDARGQKIGKLNNYGSGGGSPIPDDALSANAMFDLSVGQWKAVAKPLTLQAAISVDNGWPEEVNILLQRPNSELPTQQSKLRFIREPLPLR